MKILRYLLLITLSLALFGCGISRNITIEKYNKISTGMSYQEVVSVMGEPGKEMASTSTPAVPGIMPSISHSIYGWQNSDGSNMSVQFQNGKSIGKAQFGL